MNQPLLSILCITKAEPYTVSFLRCFSYLARACDAEFVIAADGHEAREHLDREIDVDADLIATFESHGYVESVLDQALEATRGEYVLRLDDDERASAGMCSWLRRGSFTTANHWTFPRLHLWGDMEHVIKTPLLWPDPQTRLSVRGMAGGRYSVHAASPFGFGVMAPCAIEHHKFLVKSLAERREIARRYESVQEGSGSGVFLAFSCPEDYYGALPVCPREAVLQ